VDVELAVVANSISIKLIALSQGTAKIGMQVGMGMTSVA
jgi:hypothetical protein